MFFDAISKYTMRMVLLHNIYEGLWEKKNRVVKNKSNSNQILCCLG